MFSLNLCLKLPQDLREGRGAPELPDALRPDADRRRGRTARPRGAAEHCGRGGGGHLPAKFPRADHLRELPGRLIQNVGVSL